MYSLCIKSIYIHKNLMYNIITVKGERPQGKEVAEMKFRDFQKLSKKEQYQVFERLKKEWLATRTS